MKDTIALACIILSYCALALSILNIRYRANWMKIGTYILAGIFLFLSTFALTLL